MNRMLKTAVGVFGAIASVHAFAEVTFYEGEGFRGRAFTTESSVRDFASVDGAKAIDAAVADKALRMLEVDSEGLDALDHRYLNCIAKNYEGGPVGIETISAALSEPRDALEEIVEPFLLQQGFVGRTPRGRVLTLKAYRHLGLSGPVRSATPELPIFEDNDGESGTG